MAKNKTSMYSQRKMKKTNKSSNSKNNMVYTFQVALEKSFASKLLLKKTKELPYRVIAILSRTTLY
jgi:hypothetical protein